MVKKVFSILLKILLIILIVLLIPVWLVLIALLLFTPICYKGNFRKQGEDMKAGATVGWLWRVVYFTLQWEKGGKPNIELYIIGIPLLKILRERKEKKEKQEQAEIEKKKQEQAEAEKEKQKQAEAEKEKQEHAEAEKEKQKQAEAEKEKQEHAKAEIGKPEQTQAGKEQLQQTGAETEIQQKAESEKEKPEEKAAVSKTEIRVNAELTAADKEGAGQRSSEGNTSGPDTQTTALTVREGKESRKEQKKSELHPKEGAKKKHGESENDHEEPDNKSEKLKNILDFLRSDAFKDALHTIWREVKALLKHILPRNIRGFVKFGFDDPATTGQTLGIISLLLPVIPEKLEIIPVFEEAVLEADVEASGHLFLIVILVRVIKLLLNKNVRSLLMKLLGKEKNEEKEKK